MDQKEYKAALDRAVRLAHEGKNRLSPVEYDRIFDPLSLSEEQDKLTKDYLKELHISLCESEGAEDDDLPLSHEDGNYLSFYLEEIKNLGEYSEEEKKEIFMSVIRDDDADAKEKLINMHLSDVVEIAKLYVYHGMRLEDLIGEGNIGLIMAVDLLGTVETVEEAEGLIGKTIMDSMDAAIRNDADLKSEIDRILENINKINEAASSLSGDLRRDITIKELAENSEFSVKEINDAMKFTGNAIEGLISDEEDHNE